MADDLRGWEGKQGGNAFGKEEYNKREFFPRARDRHVTLCYSSPPPGAPQLHTRSSATTIYPDSRPHRAAGPTPPPASVSLLGALWETRSSASPEMHLAILCTARVPTQQSPGTDKIQHHDLRYINSNAQDPGLSLHCAGSYATVPRDQIQHHDALPSDARRQRDPALHLSRIPPTPAPSFHTLPTRDLSHLYLHHFKNALVATEDPWLDARRTRELSANAQRVPSYTTNHVELPTPARHSPLGHPGPDPTQPFSPDQARSPGIRHPITSRPIKHPVDFPSRYPPFDGRPRSKLS